MPQSYLNISARRTIILSSIFILLLATTVYAYNKDMSNLVEPVELDGEVIGYHDYKNSMSYYTSSCLNHKGVKFYGYNWCPHCKKQKELFGESSSFLNYIECTEVECNVRAVPTWEFQDGTRLEGTQVPEVLSIKAGCDKGW